ncbi:MAG: spore germination protein GerW family protein [Methanomicrobium sp.]|nr:spore germination protein GerW family protein [Methanomicrobium sp.]
MNNEELFEKALGELDKLVKAGSTLGEPVDLGDHVIIPVASFGFAFGAGFGDENGAGGTGAGAGISPIAVVVIDKKMHGDGAVKVVPVRRPGPISEAISAIGSDLLPKVVKVIKSEDDEDKKDEKKAKEPKADKKE